MAYVRGTYSAAIVAGACVPMGLIGIGIDETIEQRCGEKIATKGLHRHPARSSDVHLVKATGLRWLCMMLLGPVSWTTRI